MSVGFLQLFYYSEGPVKIIILKNFKSLVQGYVLKVHLFCDLKEKWVDKCMRHL